MYLHTMKNQLFFLFLLFVSALSLAQSSLDSLRLEIQSLESADLRKIRSFKEKNIYFLVELDRITVGEIKSGKILYTRRKFLDYSISDILSVDSSYCFLSVFKILDYKNNLNDIGENPRYFINSNIIQWDLKNNTFKSLFCHDLLGNIVGISKCGKNKILLTTNHSLYRVDMNYDQHVCSKIYKLTNLTIPDTIILQTFINTDYGIQSFHQEKETISCFIDHVEFVFDESNQRFVENTEIYDEENDEIVTEESGIGDVIIKYITNDSMANGKIISETFSWELFCSPNYNDIKPSFFRQFKLNGELILPSEPALDYLSIISMCNDTDKLITEHFEQINGAFKGISSYKKLIERKLEEIKCHECLIIDHSIGWHSQLGLYAQVFYYKSGRIKEIIEASSAVYSPKEKQFYFIDQRLNCICGKLEDGKLFSLDTLATNCQMLVKVKDDILIQGNPNLLNIKMSNDNILIDSCLIGVLYKQDQSKFKVLKKGNGYHFLSLQDLELFQLRILPQNNYLVKLPNSPYYMCSKDASKMLHYVTPSLKVIGFEQLDPVYNRPDIVLDSIGKYFGGADQELVANYRQSWKKRIDRLGLDKEKLGKGEIAVPSAEIVGADAIAYDHKDGKLDIKVAANDPKYPLRRFNVYVNEVPLYGSAGISIAHLKKQVWDTTVSVPLSMGENKIQVSVMNELGLENFKYPSYVNYTPSEPVVAKTYYIGIGVNEFKESSHNLKYCVKDVTDLSTSFGGPNTEVKLFTNEQVTKENILALKDYLSKTTVNDKVIISCSSHGLLDDSSNFYLATHDVDFNNPKARGLKYEELENLLDGIPARQKLLLLDACNSGENDKTEILKQDLAKNQPNMNKETIEGAKGVIIKLEDENKSNFKKMNELFVNVRNNTGSVIISAAGGQESALEAITVDGKSIENGAFSYCVLEYLKNNSNKPEELTVNQLKNYVEKRVEEITNGKQQPTSRQETMEVDWRVR